MSLASLADAPSLSKSSSAPSPSPNTGWKTFKSSPPAGKNNNQTDIDALFQDEGAQGDKQIPKENSVSPFRDQTSSAKNVENRSSTSSTETHTGHAISFPPFKVRTSEFEKNLGPSNQKAPSFSKIKDPNDVLAGFLAENSSEIDINETDHLEVKSTQRDEYRSKWMSYSSDNLEPATLRVDDVHTTNATKELHDPKVCKKDGNWEMDDILSILGKSSHGDHPPSSVSNSSDIARDESEFGEYHPSCLSTSTLIHTPQRRHLRNNFLVTRETAGQKKEKSVTFQKETTFLDSSAEVPSTRRDVYQRDAVKIQSSKESGIIEDKVSGFSLPCIQSSPEENLTQLAPGLNEECKRLKNENIYLREEIMKIEAENLRLQKDLFEKEHCYEEQIARESSREKQEAQKIADDLTSQLLNLKQSLIMTEEKIELIKKAHLQEIKLLKDVHEQELEAKDRQLQSQMALLEEKHGAIETFSQLLLKADQWSAKIDELHKSMVSVKDPGTTERPEWIANIEAIVAEQESSLQMLGKRSTEICNQLEKVIFMLANNKKEIDGLQSRKEELLKMNHVQKEDIQETVKPELHDGNPTSPENGDQMDYKSFDERQATLEKFLEEKRNLEAERQAVLRMKEKISNVDASLRKELLEHGLRMQMEAEEMARQKRELEHAKNIAAEIALEVEQSRRELETCKTVFDKTMPEAHGMGVHGEVLFPSDRVLKYETEGMSRWERFQSEFCNLSSKMDPISGVEADTFYIKSQEEFLLEAERALEDMVFNPLM